MQRWSTLNPTVIKENSCKTVIGQTVQMTRIKIQLLLLLKCLSIISSTASELPAHNNDYIWNSGQKLPGALLYSLDLATAAAQRSEAVALTSPTSLQPSASEEDAPPTPPAPPTIERRLANDETYSSEDQLEADDSNEYDYDKAYEQFVGQYFDRSKDEALATDDSIESHELEAEPLLSTVTKRNTREKCRKVQRGGQHCVVCKNSKNNANSETCSYVKETEPHSYAFSKEKSFKKHRESDDDDDNDDDADESGETEAQSDEQHQEHDVTEEEEREDEQVEERKQKRKQKRKAKRNEEKKRKRIGERVKKNDSDEQDQLLEKQKKPKLHKKPKSVEIKRKLTKAIKVDKRRDTHKKRVKGLKPAAAQGPSSTSPITFAKRKDSSSCIKKTHKQQVCYHCESNEGEQFKRCFAKDATAADGVVDEATPAADGGRRKESQQQLQQTEQKLYKRMVSYDFENGQNKTHNDDGGKARVKRKVLLKMLRHRSTWH